MMRLVTGLCCALTMTWVIACASSGDDGGGGNGSGSNVGSNEPMCGDGTCAASEVGLCEADCGTGKPGGLASCGNGMCEADASENETSCPTDCMSTGSGSGGGGGGGGGNTAVNCADPDTLDACAVCSLFLICVPPLNLTDCDACFGL